MLKNLSTKEKSWNVKWQSCAEQLRHGAHAGGSTAWNALKKKPMEIPKPFLSKSQLFDSLTILELQEALGPWHLCILIPCFSS